LGRGPGPDAIPGALVGGVPGLDARLITQDGRARFLVVAFRRVLERPRLYEINVLRALLLTALRLARALAQLLLADRLLLPGEDLVEIELGLLGDRQRGRGRTLRQPGDGRGLARGEVLVGLRRPRGLGRHRPP